MTNCANQRSKGSIGHAFTVRIRTENQNQTSFYPFVPHEIFVLVELVFRTPALSFYRCATPAKLPTWRCPPPGLTREASLGSKRRGCYPASDSQRK
ncbi:hypothetical protein YC2023_072228 [Brassica napus]